MLSDNESAIYDSFLEAMANDSFLAATALLLEHGDDPHQLAQCAEHACHRIPGGPVCRARLWAKVVKSLIRGGLAPLCEGVGVGPERVRRFAAQGELLEAMVRRRTNIDGLLLAPQQIFDAAPKQREKALAYLRFVNELLRAEPRLSPRQVQLAWSKHHGSQKASLDIIKPSDWWAFSHPKWRQAPTFPGSIPGEVYANALYYFAPQTGVAVDPMAGSGTLRRVYRDRRLWEKDSEFELDVELYDLHPARDYIGRHDARRPLPRKADWIFLDPPYFGQSSHLYNGDLATATCYSEYLTGLTQVIGSMAISLNSGGRLCLFLPKWSGPVGEVNHDVPGDANCAAHDAGLTWLDCAFVSRGRQQTSGFAFQNVAAKRARRMLSDTCVLNIFEKGG